MRVQRECLQQHLSQIANRQITTQQVNLTSAGDLFFSGVLQGAPSSDQLSFARTQKQIVCQFCLRTVKFIMLGALAVKRRGSASWLVFVTKRCGFKLKCRHWTIIVIGKQLCINRSRLRNNAREKICCCMLKNQPRTFSVIACCGRCNDKLALGLLQYVQSSECGHSHFLLSRYAAFEWNSPQFMHYGGYREI